MGCWIVVLKNFGLTCLPGLRIHLSHYKLHPLAHTLAGYAPVFVLVMVQTLLQSGQTLTCPGRTEALHSFVGLD
jgi:hypothetical protein